MTYNVFGAGDVKPYSINHQSQMREMIVLKLEPVDSLHGDLVTRLTGT